MTKWYCNGWDSKCFGVEVAIFLGCMVAKFFGNIVPTNFTGLDGQYFSRGYVAKNILVVGWQKLFDGDMTKSFLSIEKYKIVLGSDEKDFWD